MISKEKSNKQKTPRGQVLPREVFTLARIFYLCPLHNPSLSRLSQPAKVKNSRLSFLIASRASSSLPCQSSNTLEAPYFSTSWRTSHFATAVWNVGIYITSLSIVVKVLSVSTCSHLLSLYQIGFSGFCQNETELLREAVRRQYMKIKNTFDTVSSQFTPVIARIISGFCYHMACSSSKPHF